MGNLTAVNDINRVSFRNKTLSKNSAKSYRNAVKQFNDYLGETGKQMSSESLKEWIEVIRHDNKPSTFNLKVQSLKEYLSERYKDDHTQLFGVAELFKSIKKEKPEQSVHEDDYLTYDKVMELSGKVTPRLSLIMLALFWTGCRVSELIDIRLEDVKINGKAIITIRSGKGNKERTVYMSLDLYEKIKWMFRGEKLLFETKSGKAYHPGNLWKEINRQGKRFGYNIHPHTFRHSKAMYLKEDKGLTPDQIAKALGHSDVAVTLRSYFHGTPSAEEQGIE